MITIEHTPYGLDVSLFSEFTLHDFKEMEQAVLECVQKGEKPSVLVDLTQVMDFTIDMALEELKFMRAHEHDFHRIAVAVSDTWMKLAAHLAGLLTHTEVQYFDDSASARRWLETAD